MPRPVFGEADWFTFEELDNPNRFRPQRCEDEDVFETAQARDADRLAQAAFPMPDDPDAPDPAHGPRGFIEWPGVEFCVSRGTKRVLMVRRRETEGADL